MPRIGPKIRSLVQQNHINKTCCVSHPTSSVRLPWFVKQSKTNAQRKMSYKSQFQPTRLVRLLCNQRQSQRWWHAVRSVDSGCPEVTLAKVNDQLGMCFGKALKTNTFRLRTNAQNPKRFVGSQKRRKCWWLRRSNRRYARCRIAPACREVLKQFMTLIYNLINYDPGSTRSPNSLLAERV